MKGLLSRALVGVAAVALVAATAARAQEVPLPGVDNTTYGGTTAEFLLLGAGARGGALGQAFAAIATDATALYWNPAGVAEMERPGFTLSNWNYVADTRYTWAGIAFPFNEGQSALGLQIGNFGFGDQPIYSLRAPEGDGSTYSVSESFFGLTYAQNFSDRFSAGITGKYINDRLAKTSASGFAVDFGTNFHALIAERPIRASFVLANLGSTLQHTGVGLDINVNRPAPPLQQQVPQDPQPARYQTESFGLPVEFRVAIAYDVVSAAASRVTFLGEFHQPSNTNPTGGAGLEWTLPNISNSGFSLTARGSYNYQADNNFSQAATPDAGFTTSFDGDEALDGLAFGGGLMYARGAWGVGLDYAYRHMGILGGTNMFSASITW
jgi:hypothetical protein